MSFKPRRCAVVASDGRRCTRPIHDKYMRHLLSTTPAELPTLIRIAEAWGWSPRLASAAARGAVSNGPISGDKFADMLEAAAQGGLGG